MPLRTLLMPFVFLLVACIPPLSPMERLANAAHELNSATRFARMDIALSNVAEDGQRDFARRHAAWHRDLRIVDVEIVGVEPLTPDTADIRLAVSWHTLDNTTLQSSNVVQRWTQDREGWKLTDETRTSGAKGLFGESMAKEHKPRLDGVTTSSWQ
ncbi:MAG TPA: hypothetical protein VFB62_27485 [Polyangiaceae bacterium]|nr:hypothetical protein [Polyangiaceae bacterium]